MNALCSGLQPLHIGNVAVGFPVVQAALSGYSDWPMRVVSRQHGAAYALCEVMLDRFLVEVKPRQKNRHFLYIGDDEQPILILQRGNTYNFKLSSPESSTSGYTGSNHPFYLSTGTTWSKNGYENEYLT